MSNITRRTLVGSAAAIAAIRPVRAAEPLKIGWLSDFSGIMVDYSGLGSATAAAMAVEDAGGSVLGRPVQILRGDHLSKPDVGLAIARGWYDEGVRAIFDVGLTSVALGVQNLTREKDRILVLTSTASADFTGANCSPNGIHWTFNNYSQALGAIKYVSDHGAKTWFFLTVDYTYGRNVQRDATAMIEARGGRVLGASVHPFESSDYSSYLVAAKSSGADAIALATTTAHAAAIIKQADEFGIRTGGQQIVPLSITLHDVKAIGLQAAQGMIETAPYYWNQDDATRAFAARYEKRVGKMPNMAQASAYGAVAFYLKAVAAAGTDETGPVLAKMHSMKINDFMTHDGWIRPDGRVMREMYILKVKSPSQSTGPWDLEDVVGTLSPEDSFGPPSPACQLNKA